jgi:hypothetical protein
MLKMYSTSDKEKFPCFYPEYNDKRIDTTFYADFFVAWKVGGVKGIKDTYNKCFKQYKTDIKYMVELTGALNHMLWHTHSVLGDHEITRLFEELYFKNHKYCCNNFKDDDLEFYTMVLD